jgi:hypothetical protein
MLDAWIKRQRRFGAIRLHWVMEFQRRGVPHLHVAAWYDLVKIPTELNPAHGHALGSLQHSDMQRAGKAAIIAAAKAVSDWLEVASSCEPGPKGQQVRPIDGPVGWFQYLAKHCGRGRNHYQRQQESHPHAWQGSPRVWGKVGSWSLVQPAYVDLTTSQWYRLRRLVRAQRVARARAAVPGPGWSWSGLWSPLLTRDQLRAAPVGVAGKGRPLRDHLRNLQHARRMLSCTDRKLSEVRGVSEWMTEAEQLDLLRAIG